MKDTHLTVKGIQYKIVDESWEDRTYEVDHPCHVIYRLDDGKWEKIGETTDSWNAESYIPGLYERKQCPTCGHWDTERTTQ